MKHFDVDDFRKYKIYSSGISKDELRVRPELLSMAASDVELENPKHLKTLKNPFGLFAIFSSTTLNENLLIVYCEGVESLAGYCVVDDAIEFLR